MLAAPEKRWMCYGVAEGLAELDELEEPLELPGMTQLGVGEGTAVLPATKVGVGVSVPDGVGVGVQMGRPVTLFAPAAGVVMVVVVGVSLARAGALAGVLVASEGAAVVDVAAGAEVVVVAVASGVDVVALGAVVSVALTVGAAAGTFEAPWFLFVLMLSSWSAVGFWHMTVAPWLAFCAWVWANVPVWHSAMPGPLIMN